MHVFQSEEIDSYCKEEKFCCGTTVMQMFFLYFVKRK